MSEQESLFAEKLSALVDAVCEAAGRRRHRAVVVLSGEAQWCRQQAAEVVARRQVPHCWWLGESSVSGCDGLDWSRARTRLGMEVGQLVIDAFDGFDAEGFGALSGTVRAGGLLLLLTPPLERWHRHVDPQHARLALYPLKAEAVSGHFLKRVAQSLLQAPGVVCVEQGQPLPAAGPLPEPSGDTAADGVFAGPEQRMAVAAIRRVAEGPSHPPLVLSADRGRGKSAALGIAAAQLLLRGLRQVVVTAPRYVAAAQVFEHARQLLPGCEAHRGELLWQGALVQFVAPDALFLVPREAQLLLVDEAAAIPTPILERLLQHYPRIVFSTTIHGYEGTGRGFAVRFQQVLNERTPGWQKLHLSEPVRWARGDVLEAISFRALLLDAEPVAAGQVSAANVENCRVERLDSATLAGDEEQLAELFGLLVLAHYRTSPNDLRQLLDGPQQSLFVLKHNGHIVATAVVVHEGGLEPALAQEVYLGRRRVQGHLLPQSLANHCGYVEAASQRTARVMRIAVHPALQGRGLGTLLLQHIDQAMRRTGCDSVGASFGATAQLLQFWQQQGMLPVRVGLQREASSGTHSVLVLKPLSQRGATLFQALRERFCESLPLLLSEPLSELDDDMAGQLLASSPPVQQSALGAQDRRDLESFAFGLRGYEVCMLAIHKLVLGAFGDRTVLALLNESEQQLLRDKVVRQHSWPQVVKSGGFDGRKAAIAALRGAVATLYRAMCN